MILKRTFNIQGNKIQIYDNNGTAVIYSVLNSKFQQIADKLKSLSGRYDVSETTKAVINLFRKVSR